MHHGSNFTKKVHSFLSITSSLFIDTLQEVTPYYKSIVFIMQVHCNGPLSRCVGGMLGMHRVLQHITELHCHSAVHSQVSSFEAFHSGVKQRGQIVSLSQNTVPATGKQVGTSVFGFKRPISQPSECRFGWIWIFFTDFNVEAYLPPPAAALAPSTAKSKRCKQLDIS